MCELRHGVVLCLRVFERFSCYRFRLTDTYAYFRHISMKLHLWKRRGGGDRQQNSTRTGRRMEKTIRNRIFKTTSVEPLSNPNISHPPPLHECSTAFPPVPLPIAYRFWAFIPSTVVIIVIRRRVVCTIRAGSDALLARRKKYNRLGVRSRYRIYVYMSA